jgi:hypothetical protein
MIRGHHTYFGNFKIFSELNALRDTPLAIGKIGAFFSKPRQHKSSQPVLSAWDSRTHAIQLITRTLREKGPRLCLRGDCAEVDPEPPLAREHPPFAS